MICPYCERKFAYGVPVECGSPTVDASARKANISQTNTRELAPDVDLDLAAHLTKQGVRFWVVDNRQYMFADFDSFDKWPTDAGFITRRDGDKLSKLKERPYAIWIVRGGRWLCVDSNNRMSAIADTQSFNGN